MITVTRNAGGNPSIRNPKAPVLVFLLSKHQVSALFIYTLHPGIGCWRRWRGTGAWCWARPCRTACVMQ